MSGCPSQNGPYAPLPLPEGRGRVAALYVPSHHRKRRPSDCSSAQTPVCRPLRTAPPPQTPPSTLLFRLAAQSRPHATPRAYRIPLHAVQSPLRPPFSLPLYHTTQGCPYIAPKGEGSFLPPSAHRPTPHTPPFRLIFHWPPKAAHILPQGHTASLCMLPSNC